MHPDPKTWDSPLNHVGERFGELVEPKEEEDEETNYYEGLPDIADLGAKVTRVRKM